MRASTLLNRVDATNSTPYTSRDSKHLLAQPGLSVCLKRGRFLTRFRSTDFIHAEFDPNLSAVLDGITSYCYRDVGRDSRISSDFRLLVTNHSVPLDATFGSQTSS